MSYLEIADLSCLQTARAKHFRDDFLSDVLPHTIYTYISFKTNIIQYESLGHWQGTTPKIYWQRKSEVEAMCVEWSGETTFHHSWTIRCNFSRSAVVGIGELLTWWANHRKLCLNFLTSERMYRLGSKSELTT